MIALHADASALACRHIRNTCVRALWQELVTYPKPGLVSLEDAGSHADMDASHFHKSLFALRGYFASIAAAGCAGQDFPALRAIGVRAEVRMNRATGGVNTHRGAIFNLGLLAAAAGYRAATASPRSLGTIVQSQWGEALLRHRRDPRSHGARMAKQSNAGGALAQAAAGFPAVYGHGLPAYRRALEGGASEAAARVQAFFQLLAHVEDTNLLYRGGVQGLAMARGLAGEFLGMGGVHATGWIVRALAVHRAFVDKNLSPGGSADLLAVTLVVHALEGAAA